MRVFPNSKMCGIWALIGRGHTTLPPLVDLEKYVLPLTARGPEGTRIKTFETECTLCDENDHHCACCVESESYMVCKKCIAGNVPTQHALGFTRLAINGLNEAGMQPFEWTAPDGSKYAWVCNGEIYNWKELAADFGLEAKLKSGSDCEIIGPLYHRLKDRPATFARALDGVFAIVLLDIKQKECVVLRDPYGIRPLFQTVCKFGDEGSEEYYNMFSSELKGFGELTKNIAHFPPGEIHILNTEDAMRRNKKIPYHDIPYEKIAAFNNLEAAEMTIEKGLRMAVRKRLMTERPVAALLSGGVDSSLIAALAADELRIAGVERPLETFSIGFEGSEDLRYARMVAEWIGSKHHEIIMTPDEFFAAIPEVVAAIESFDITTVRASVGNYLVSKAIRERSDCKVVFNGDGSDEIFGSYLYFYKAPSNQEFERETQRLLGNIHYFDVLRSDRSISSHGLEPRTPFLDKSFVAAAMAMPTKWRRPGTRHGSCEPICEKWLLRRAFMDSGLLPPEVLWRRKEAFSDGVSGPVKSWYEEIQERVQEKVPGEWENIATHSFSEPAEVIPKTAEAFYYRHLFAKKFKSNDFAEAAVPFFWMPRWIEGASDPSARTLAVYKETEKTE